MAEDCLNEKTRAEDILLGSLGFAEEAQILSITASEQGYSGKARWADGEEFEFEYEEGLDDLQRWALEIFIKGKA